MTTPATTIARSGTRADAAEAPPPPFECDPHSADYQTNLPTIASELRDRFPVYHNAERDLYIISRYADVRAILLDEETFSVEGVEEAQQLPPMLTYLDGLRHTKLRNLVSRGFTPRRIEEIEARVRAIARQLLDAIEEAGDAPCDLMSTFAAQLPSRVIAELIGVPEERRTPFLVLTESLIETGPTAHEIAEPAAQIIREFAGLLEERRRAPTEDLMSALLAAEVDGERLSEQELLGFCSCCSSRATTRR